jgi:resuscitation-promoting factor RpfB
VLRVTRLGLVWELCLLAGLVLVGAAGCQPTAKRVIILVDGQRREVETQAATVAQVLREQKIELGENDRLDPPGYTPIDRTATIRIVRVETKTEKTTEPIEFSRQLLRDDSLPAGKMQVVRLGANGEAQVTFQITLEDDKEVSRREVRRMTIKPPSDEILEVGTQNSLPPVRFNGALVYLAHGNAWVMRDTTDDKRPLTYEGDLDGRVFDLSPDGRYLIFTRSSAAANGGPSQLNSLWLVDTLVLGEKPRRLPLDNLLYAQWASDGSNQIAYSTGEKTGGAPGWKARNDLYIATLSGISATPPIMTPLLTSLPSPHGESSALTLTGRQIIPPSVPAPYAWWGADWAWSPDGQAFAFGFADQVGLVNVSTGARRAVKTFAYYNTRSDWVWTPQIAWSPDSRYIIATVHAPPEGAGAAEDSPAFDLWAFARDNSMNLDLAPASGMWSSPTWSPPDANSESRIAYGEALNAADTERSPYALHVMDRDGSNRIQIFPQENEAGLPLVQLAWSPDASQLAAVRDGDLWLYDFHWGVWLQLTANGDTRFPRWK